MSIALSQSQLSPVAGSTARVAACAALVSAWGSMHPASIQAATGMQPWVQLSALEAAAALMLAAGLASLLRRLLVAGLWLLRRALPHKPPRHALLLSKLCIVSAAIGGALHPALPIYVGCLCLAVQLAAATQQQQLQAEQHSAVPNHSGSKGTTVAASWQCKPLSWLSFYIQLALLPTVSLYCWLVSGWPRHAVLGAIGITAMAVGLHACLVQRHGNSSSSNRSEAGRWLAQAALHEAAACAVATSSLWGHPFVALYAAAASAVGDFLIGG